MSKTAILQIQIDSELKTKAQEILERLNISMSEAVSLYLTQLTLHKGIPFDVRTPNELTAETIRKSEAGIELYAVNSIAELFEELEN